HLWNQQRTRNETGTNLQRTCNQPATNLQRTCNDLAATATEPDLIGWQSDMKALKGLRPERLEHRSVRVALPRRLTATGPLTRPTGRHGSHIRGWPWWTPDREGR